jgi:hypothetical protein
MRFNWPKTIRPSRSDEQLLLNLVPRQKVIPDMEILNIRERVCRAFESEYEELDSVVARSQIRYESNTHETGIFEIQTRVSRDVWYSYDVVKVWERQQRIRLINDHFVRSCRQSGEFVETCAEDTSGKTTFLRSRRVFVATGPLGTAQLVLSSGLTQKVRIYDTPTAFGGFISPHSEPRRLSIPDDRPQWWLRKGSPSKIFVQIYSPSQSNSERIAANLPRIMRIPRLIDGLSLKTFPMIAYFGNTKSEYIDAELTKNQKIKYTASESREMRMQFRGELQNISAMLRQSSSPM